VRSAAGAALWIAVYTFGPRDFGNGLVRDGLWTALTVLMLIVGAVLITTDLIDWWREGKDQEAQEAHTGDSDVLEGRDE